MFNAVLQFILLFLLTTAFILIVMLLGAFRARRLQEERDHRDAERRRNEARRERRKLGERPAIPARVLQPPASLSGVPIYRKPARPLFGRQAGQHAQGEVARL
jgi:hypothetical protein